MDLNKILEILPHRYPLLLVDRVLDIQDDSIKAQKNVTYNEQFFQGHFPGLPVMPGVLIVEALAQTAGIYAYDKIGDEGKGKFVFFMAIDNVKFRKKVVPGDVVILNCRVLRFKKGLLKVEAWAEVDDEKACEAVLTAVMRDS